MGYDQGALALTQGGIARFVGIMASEFYRDRPDIVADMDRCLAEGKAIKRKTLYPFRSTDESRHLALTCVPVLPLEGDTARLLLLAEDITGEVQAGLSLQVAREAAEQARREEEARRHEAERRRRIAEGLGAILTALNSDRPLEEILDLIASRARRLLETQAVGIYRLESKAGRWAVEASRGLLVTYVAGSNVPLGQDTLREAIVARRPVTGLPEGAVGTEGVVPAHGAHLADTLPSRSGAGLRARASSWPGWYKAWLAVPILTTNRVFGGMLCYYAEPRTCSEEEIQLAVAFSHQAALAVENAHLRKRIEQVAAAAERERLARELHDVVTQTLFSASVIAETLPRIWASNPEEVKSGIEELGRLTRGALAEMRTLLVELRPAALTDKP
ncbi:MAG: histidine kinase, partial [Anaerolineae bacterium]